MLRTIVFVCRKSLDSDIFGLFAIVRCVRESRISQVMGQLSSFPAVHRLILSVIPWWRRISRFRASF